MKHDYEHDEQMHKMLHIACVNAYTEHTRALESLGVTTEDLERVIGKHYAPGITTQEHANQIALSFVIQGVEQDSSLFEVPSTAH
jgi:N-dimethylarginine dimethylaminohydrolase